MAPSNTGASNPAPIPRDTTCLARWHAFCFPPLSYELWSRCPGQDQDLTQNKSTEHTRLWRGVPRELNSLQLSWERLKVKCRRWSIAISSICSLTNSPPTLFYVGMFITVRKTLVLPFFPWQFSFKEPLKYLVSDAYKHLLKCSFIGG